MAKKYEYRQFPVGNNELQEYVIIPVNKDGEPIRSSAEWRTMIADAMAKNPDDRSPAERAAVRKEIQS